MIEITLTHPNGLRDVAEADTPEGALLAARTLYDEARDAIPYQGLHKHLVLVFWVDGEPIRSFFGARP